ncbi:MAG: hypothetical protein M3434_03510 [Gemmatimonadota bacterium]|nr:hypothetical protein [Gemmatimonadota bacterium]
MEFPNARADKVTARIGEPVEVTVTGGFGARDDYYLEEFVQPGVNLGACFWYVPERTVNGGLCISGEQPLPDGLSMVDSATFAKNFGDIVVKRGESQNIEHTFTFTSNEPGEVVVEPSYWFRNDTYEGNNFKGHEPGALNIIRITFE